MSRVERLMWMARTLALVLVTNLIVVAAFARYAPLGLTVAVVGAVVAGFVVGALYGRADRERGDR